MTPEEFFTFGRYPQTAEGTDSTPIEWLVPDAQDSKLLVISRYGCFQNVQADLVTLDGSMNTVSGDADRYIRLAMWADLSLIGS